MKNLILLQFNFEFVYLIQAEAEKEKGNEAYKKKDFETALNHYNKATELDPVNMTYYTNRAGRVDSIQILFRT